MRSKGTKGRDAASRTARSQDAAGAEHDATEQKQSEAVGASGGNETRAKLAVRQVS